MSEGKKLGRPFTPETAPRQGGKPGRKARLSAEALLILERLMKDRKKYGDATLRILRKERPELYAKLALETAAKLGMAETVESVVNDVPTILIVRWGSPGDVMPPPPEPVLPASSPFTPPSLTLLPKPPDDELN